MTKFKNLLPTLLLLFFATAGILTSCNKDDDEECVSANMSYMTDIVPILEDNGCMASSCHGGGNASGAADYSTYADLKSSVDAMRLLGAIKREEGFSPMPKVGDKMSDCDISKVESWVNAGALDN